MKREILLIGGKHGGQYIETSYDPPIPIMNIPKIKHDLKFVPEDNPLQTVEPDFDVYHLQKFRSSKNVDFLVYVLEGIDPLEELFFSYGQP